MTDLDRLEAMLDQMHACVMSANFDDLPRILDETSRLADAIGKSVNLDAAQRLKYKATRNGHCLQAAARGLRAAQRRLGEVSEATARLSTYTSKGHRSAVAVAPGTLAQRL